MKKLRSDSTFNRLGAGERARVDDMLLSGLGYDEVREYMAGRGHPVSRTSVAEYYHVHIWPRKWARQQRLARELEAVDTTGMDAATLNALRERAMELAVTPGSEVKHVNTIYNLVLKAQAQRLEGRRVALLERKAAAADAARAALEQRVHAGGLTPEALALAEEALHLL